MGRSSFNHGWTVRPRTSVFAQLAGGADRSEAVTLPHDALIAQARTPDGPGKSAYFPASSAFAYTRAFEVPETWRDKHVSLAFEGAYRDAMVYVNDAFTAQWRYGYSGFVVPLDGVLLHGRENTIRVETRAHDDARWYTGNGLLRDVSLTVTDLLHVDADSVAVTTPDVDGERAVIEVAVPVVNLRRSWATARVECTVRDAAGRRVAHGSAPVTVRGGGASVVRRRLYLVEPRRWSVDDPYLYRVEVELRADQQVLDTWSGPLGVRTLRLDPVHGLRVNGESVELRGACVHHDNGLLGAAVIGRAEERRVEILKDAGFNAIRGAHKPLSRAMLDACDRLGVLVMDEAFDVWTEGKSSFDYSVDFAEWWERDVEAMVAKDRNHPSVVFYSIGNEIPETGSGLGADWGRRLAEKVRELDPTRFVTNGVNGFVSVLKDVAATMRERADHALDGGVNAAMDSADGMMSQIAASALVTSRTEETFSVLDVAGINYGDSRYETDAELFPDRIIVGTETYPAHIDRNWRLVQDNPHVIGDFTWTGWDYLGEVGIGRLRHADDPGSFEGPYPWRTAWCGDIDITGHRRPQSYYREIVFGRRTTPYIAVERPEAHGRGGMAGQWAWTDAVSSWTWEAEPGAPVRVEVYSAAEEVELVLNGVSVGRRPAGREHRFRALFELGYAPGTLVAIGYSGGVEHARATLRTAGADLGLSVRVDRENLRATAHDLAFVDIELRDGDGDGIPVPGPDRPVRVRVAGAGVLQGLGTGRPDSTEPFTADHCTTFRGRALAVVRPTAAGRIEVTVTAEGLTPVSRTLQVAEDAGARPLL